MARQLLANDETEYEVVEYPTGKQQREFNRLQMKAAHIPVQQKRSIAQAYKWVEEFEDKDGNFDPPEELDIETFRVKAAQIVFEDFDAPLNDETRDSLRGGLVQEGIQDFLSRCGGKGGGQQGYSNALRGLLSVLDNTDTATANSRNTARP